MAALTEVLHAGGFLVSESDQGFYSRSQVTMINTTALIPGTVVSKTGVPASETATVAVDASNVGTGVLTMDVTAPIAAGAIDGVYEVILRATSATASFDVVGPDGAIVDNGNVATTFNGVLKFMLANAGTMTIGDRWLITVNRSVAANLWGVLDVTASAGKDVAAGILFDGFAAGSGTQQVTIISRHAEVRTADLTWPSGFTATQIAKGVVQLRAVGIIPR